MNYKENCGCDPITMRQGYKKLDGGPDRMHDHLVPASDLVTETDHGGFLGRTEQQDSESAKA